ncbi:SDR family NAD(P)-dependent oxidoreductase [Candidatus Fermentibacteria bacterium]|nr:SDR family NAD(P)-dependent oxidoreductase [Candidatus Fermentibacteria bacterium]
MGSPNLSMFDLTGKTAIVTGASQGLGVSYARGLAKAGCDLVLAARSLDKLEEVANEIRQWGHRALPVKMDVTRVEDIQSAVEKAVSEFGHIDVLVNNAGISAVHEAEDMSEREWNDVISTNLTGVFHCAQSVGRVMIGQKYGKIINIASMYAFVGSSYVPQASYTASKSAVLGLTKELAVEWGPKGVHVLALAPGFFRSDQTIWAFENNKELGEKLLHKVPLGRMGRLEELEGTIVYLASSASDYLHGQALVLDGGFLSW